MDRPKSLTTGMQPHRLRRLVVPLALTVAVLAAAAAAVSTGCGDDTAPADASSDAAPDTPIV